MTEGKFLGLILSTSSLHSLIAIEVSVKKKHPSVLTEMSSLANAGLARYAVSIIHHVPKLILTRFECDYCKQKKFRYINYTK